MIFSYVPFHSINLFTIFFLTLFFPHSFFSHSRTVMYRVPWDKLVKEKERERKKWKERGLKMRKTMRVRGKREWEREREESESERESENGGERERKRERERERSISLGLPFCLSRQKIQMIQFLRNGCQAWTQEISKLTNNNNNYNTLDWRSQLPWERNSSFMKQFFNRK